MAFSFAAHVALFTRFLDRRPQILEAIETRLLKRAGQRGLARCQPSRVRADSQLVLRICQGKDALITDVPASAIEVLRLTCPEFLEVAQKRCE